MDDAKSLVAELLAKLAELDSKVATYQQDMNAEFERYSTLLLKDVPEDVSNEVSRVIAESMSNYPMLCAPNREYPDRPAAFSRYDLWDGRRSPPPILYHTSGTPKEGPRSPHAREKEFQGVFTPTFLPLLGSNDRSPQSPPASPLPLPSPAFSPPVDRTLPVDDGREGREGRSAANVTRPSPIRRQTDGTVSSMDSSESESKGPRRSALRRSSSSAKGSPRRVRFELQGTEVLPTCSPQATTNPGSSPDPGPHTSLEEAEVPASAIIDDSPAYGGPSLLDVEGEEDSLPRPKKVSSTQALRALSRNPLDEGTVWTVVNADPEETPKMDSSRKDTPRTGSDPTTAATDVAESAAIPAATQRPHSQQPEMAPAPTKHIPQGATSEDSAAKTENDDDGSEDDFLSMRPKASKQSPSPIMQPQPAGTPAAENVKMQESNAQYEMFDFEAGEDTISGTSHRPRDTEKYLPETQEDVEDDRLESSPKHPTRAAHSALPTVPIPKASPDTQPMTSASARLMQGSIGSYKGHSIMMSAIVNPKVQEEAAAMGDFNSFVGSVDGRSGFDAADLGSFRASLNKAMSGVPCSFSERMAMEELLDDEDE